MHKVLEIHHKQVRKRLHLGDGEEQNRGQKRRSRKSLFPVKTQSTVEPYWAAVSSLTLRSSFPVAAVSKSSRN